MYTITKAIDFVAAHRLIEGYTGKCSSLHGHQYKAVFEFKAPVVDQYGFVIDFSHVKARVKDWIDSQWDHGTILNSKDSIGPVLSKLGQKIYYLPGNPTAEHMAEFLYKIFHTEWETLQGESYLSSVTVWETSTSSAEYKPPSAPPFPPEPQVYG